MNIRPSIYLCGPIAFCNDAEATDWREYVKNQGKLYDEFDCIDPMDRDFRGKEMNDNISKMIVTLDYFDIRTRANTLLANLDFTKPMVGSIMEIKDAFDRGKLTVIVMPIEHPVSPWLSYHSHKIENSLDDAITYITSAFKVKVK